MDFFNLFKDVSFVFEKTSLCEDGARLGLGSITGLLRQDAMDSFKFQIFHFLLAHLKRTLKEIF